MRTAATLCFLTTLFWAGGATAQPAPPITIDVGALYTVQPQTESPSAADPAYPRPGVGGRAIGFVAGAAVPIASRVGLGVELSDPGRFDAVQTTSGFSVARIDNRHRDLIISGLLHIHPRPGTSRISLDGVAGLSVVREDTVQQTAYAPPGSHGPYDPIAPEQHITRTTYGVTGGVDLDISVGQHFSLVPQARVFLISREQSPSGTESATLGLSPLVFRAAVAIQASF